MSDATAGSTTGEYRPGHCNIGPRQRRKRYLVATAAFGAAALYVLVYLAGLVPSPLLVAVFIPLSIGFEWGLQAYTAFCVRLAVRNEYDFRGDDGEKGAVDDPVAQHEDHVQATKLTGAAVGLAAAVTAVLVFLLT